MPYPPPPEIVLPHPWVIGEFRLRVPEPKDVPALVGALQAIDIQRWTRIPVPYTAADAEWYVHASAEWLEEGSAIAVLITDPPGRELYGGCGLEIDWRDRTAELGFWLHANARGRGLVTRSAAELCRFGFGLGVGRVGMQTAVSNTASAAVAERLGFTHEGTFRNAGIDGPAGDPSAPRVDMLQFGLLPGELRTA